jgi:HSP20 family protein
MTATKTPTEVRQLPSRLREHPLAWLREEFDDLLSRVIQSGENGWFPLRFSPECDVAETDKAVEVRLEIPGIDAKDLDIRIRDNVLTVSGEKKEEKEEKGKTFYRSERRYGRFSRSVTLPCSVQDDKTEARYHDGVVTISMIKAPEAQAKRIEVKA